MGIEGLGVIFALLLLLKPKKRSVGVGIKLLKL